jgi:menaquinone-dependent protoporphyrinogen IX oxidase
MKTLVAYYSRTGYTRRVADLLAARLGGTPYPITESRSRLGLLGYSRSAVEASLGLDASIVAPSVDPARFDLVLIGTPVWAWHLSSPVRAFAKGQAGSIRRCAFFCTMGGAGAERAFADLERCLGQAPLATLALTDREIDRERYGSRIESFVAALRSRGLELPAAMSVPSAAASA